MARTKDVNVTPEREEKMTQEVMASFQSSAYGKSDERDYSPLFGELDDAASVNSEAATNAESSNMEGQPTNESQLPPNPQKRISGKQRKATLEEYQHTFLQVPRIDDRKPVFVSSEVRDRLDRIVRILGGRRMSVSGIIENIVRHHLDLYEEDFEAWRKL